MAAVSSLVIYPLKGARGIEVETAKVTSTGLAFDRHFVIVNDSASGRFETQRSEPRLALVETRLPLDVLTGERRDLENIDLELTAPGCGVLKIPLAPEESGSFRAVKVWDWAGKGLDQGDRAAEYLSQYFGKPVRLVRYAGTDELGSEIDGRRRSVDKSWAPESADLAFSDGFPLLLANEASLEDLNQQLEKQAADRVPMNRFRPNIVVRGASAWEEDEWEDFRLGDVDFSSVKPCDRCKVTTTDQETATIAKNQEPLKTLATIRSGSVLGWDSREPKWKNSVFMGWNLIPKSPGKVTVGDTLEKIVRRSSVTGPVS